ncbi:hypothetical protein [Moraxella lacunata]|uniref:hypothetical protein n=1 Tax=Moraxella lacunata TaxID=477 RepID=UPI003EDE9D7B
MGNTSALKLTPKITKTCTATAITVAMGMSGFLSCRIWLRKSGKLGTGFLLNQNG